jgi:multidrug efflux pump subunit AcrA (membrane-fusion protein)
MIIKNVFARKEFIVFKFTIKNTIFWGLIVVILLGIGGGAYYYYTVNAKENAANKESTLETAVAYSGELTVIASGTGTVVAAKSIEMAFEYDGTVTELNVSVGDKVNKAIYWRATNRIHRRGK